MNPLFYNDKEWIQEALELLDQEKEWSSLLKQRIINAPEGRLVIHAYQSGYQYYNNIKGKRIYLSGGQTELARALAQKAYDKKALCILGKWEKREKTIKSWAEDNSLWELYESMSPERRRLVTPLVCSPCDFVEEWLAEEYEGLGFQEHEAEFYAADGTRVRSKSERDTVDELLEFHVPCKYEKPLQLKGFGLVYPDFHVLNRRTGQEFVWEHFGMMDDRSYAVDNIRKLEAYHYNGYFEGVNFISTWETRRTPFGRRDARRVIEQYLL